MATPIQRWRSHHRIDSRRNAAASGMATWLAEATEVQQEALQRIEEARVRLEDIRQNQPEI